MDWVNLLAVGLLRVCSLSSKNARILYYLAYSKTMARKKDTDVLMHGNKKHSTGYKIFIVIGWIVAWPLSIGIILAPSYLLLSNYIGGFSTISGTEHRVLLLLLTTFLTIVCSLMIFYLKKHHTATNYLGWKSKMLICGSVFYLADLLL